MRMVYVVARLYRFDLLEFEPNPRMPVEIRMSPAPDQPSHYLPVFETLELAKSWAPEGATIFEMRVGDDEPKDDPT